LATDGIQYLMLDGWYPKVRIGKRCVRVPVLVTLGVRAHGDRVILDVRLVGDESTAAWRDVIHGLVARHIGIPTLAVIDGNPGLAAALFWSQWAAIDSCWRGMTEGTSAQLTNQFAPAATVRPSVHPLSVRSEKRRVALSPDRSTQLSTTRSPSVASCGWALLAAAGEDTVATSSGQFACLELIWDAPCAEAITSVRVQSRTAATCFTDPPCGCEKSYRHTPSMCGMADSDAAAACDILGTC